MGYAITLSLRKYDVVICPFRSNPSDVWNSIVIIAQEFSVMILGYEHES